MTDKVFSIVGHVMGVPVESVSMASSPDTIESWDSLKHMNLILALEQSFNITFTDEQVVDLLNVELITLTLKELGC